MSLPRSEYFATLSGDVLSRYLSKIEIINNVDPYTLAISESATQNVPAMSMLDLFIYLVETHGYYTTQQLKGMKNLTAYENYSSGAILEFMMKKINDVFVVLSKVHQSQEMEEPLEVWIIILSDGSVSSAHCKCMTGLDEVCDHVATVLFGLYARSSGADGNSCPDQSPALPMENMRLREMDWVSKVKQSSSYEQIHIPPMSKEEINVLLEKFYSIGICSAISLLTEPLASKIANETKK